MCGLLVGLLLSIGLQRTCFVVLSSLRFRASCSQWDTKARDVRQTKKHMLRASLVHLRGRQASKRRPTCSWARPSPTKPAATPRLRGGNPPQLLSTRLYPRDPLAPSEKVIGDTVMHVRRVQPYLLRFSTTGSLGIVKSPQKFGLNGRSDYVWTLSKPMMDLHLV